MYECDEIDDASPTLDSPLGLILEEYGGAAASEDGEQIDSFLVTHSAEVSSGSDVMLNHESEELGGRVIALEKKVQDQQDELVCLKSTLADVIRRLTAVETSKVIQNNVLPSRPNVRTSRRPAGPVSPVHSPGTRNSSDSKPSSVRGSSSSSRAVPHRAASTPSPQMMRKWPSVPSTTSADVIVPTSNGSVGARHSGSLTSLSTAKKSPSTRYREPSYSQEDGCVKIHLRGRSLNFYTPTRLENYDVRSSVEAPSEQLKLEWVYGYRGRDARCNLYLLPTGEVVYFIAAIVILYNAEEQMQRHYLEHTDDIKCLAVHPDRITIATGQVAGHEKGDGKPHIRIWDSVSLNTLKVIGLGEFERAVACVGFSKTDGGQYMVAIDDSSDHTISLWEWQSGEHGHKITETKSTADQVLAAEFHPCQKNSIITCGKNHICFWTIDGVTLTRKMGLFEMHSKPKFVTCIAFGDNGDVLSGDSNGNFIIWERVTHHVGHIVHGAHDGGIFSILVLKDGTILTAGKDRRIVSWNADYTRAGLEHEIPEPYGPIRMLSQGKGNMLLVGTTRNNILQGTLQLKFSPIIQGHVDELWGLACHPNQNQLITCGYDRNLYLWDTLTHSAIWCLQMEDSCHCVTFNPDGNLIAITTTRGKWSVVDVTTREVISEHLDGSEVLECIRYSPDGMKLAVGSRDNLIYMYSISGDGRHYNRVGRCSGHSSFIMHIDWSVDSDYLRSNSGDYELLYWSASTCRQMTSASSMRDTEWATHTCTLSFTTCGIWQSGSDGTDINACCVSNKHNLIATADDFGKVNLYKYPCAQPHAAGHSFRGHSSHVTNVEFLHDDNRLMSVGGRDSAILQWQVV